MHKYHINVFWSDEDDCWVATIPDLWPCSAFGDSPEEALHEVLVVKDLKVESARERGHPILEPRYRPPARTS